MFSWFRSMPKCPGPCGDGGEWIDDRWAWLEGQFGLERLRNSRVILPVPRVLSRGVRRHASATARRMLDRVCGYMDIDPAAVEICPQLKIATRCTKASGSTARPECTTPRPAGSASGSRSGT